MKILALTKRRDACWWLRVLNPMSLMNSRGHSYEDELLEQSLVCPACGTGVQEVHWNNPKSEFMCIDCGNPLMSRELISAWQENLLRLIDDAEVVAFQRPTSVQSVALMKHCKNLGKKVVQLCDDDYLNVPQDNPGYMYYLERRAAVEDTLRLSDAINVTTRPLADLYSSYSKNISLIPNCLDLDAINVTPEAPVLSCYSSDRKAMSLERLREMSDGRKVILWGGSPTHEKDLEIVINPIRRISRSEKVLFCFVGYVHRAFLEILRPDQIALFSLIPHSMYFSVYKAIRADIGLAPVAESKFNAGKSGLKALEYSALGILPVVSQFVTYAGLLPGQIEAKNADYDWYVALRNAINMSPEERETRVSANLQKVESDYDIKTQVVQWERFFESL